MARKRFVDEAAASALVRFGPELSALKELMASTGTEYRQKVNSAQAGATGIQAAVASAVPQLQALYAGSLREGIPGLSGTQAINDMIGRGVRAQESAAGSRRTALSELAADRAKIKGRQSDISQEIGAFTASEAGKLSQDAADRSLRLRISQAGNSQSERNSLRSSGIDPDTGAPIPGGKLDPKAKTPKPKTPAAAAAKRFEDKYGVKPQTTVQHNALRSKVDSTVAVIKDQIAAGNSNRGQLGQLLTLGRPAKTVQLPNGQKVPLPSISKVDPFIASVALDIAVDGKISGKNAAEAHRRGYSVRALGLPNRAPRRRRRQGPPAPAGPAGPIRT